ncbi:DUF1653 domain-containing protein [Sphaerochaeta sp. PS]|uniref:DUF1653 domain-containing protein n=1 Tax=Sphaerochaeta sp. PS TaxID=3076336 RepID=UPI0028A459CD|nr:DUF1653 domain-containing protein [Sphaerochaeta sp. PS]MDT4762658.1 DUF1653 domain-containing protein [Sphaerochaeta sp. PS]
MVEKKQIKPGWYRHFKGGLYEVIDTVIDSESLQTMVLYRPENSTDLWVRPYDMFLETVSKDGFPIPRFSPLQKG